MSGPKSFKIARRSIRLRAVRDIKEQSIKKSVILPINSRKYNSTHDTLNEIKESDNLIAFASIHPEEDNIDRKIIRGM